MEIVGRKVVKRTNWTIFRIKGAIALLEELKTTSLIQSDIGIGIAILEGLIKQLKGRKSGER